MSAKVKELAVAQLKEVLRLIESGEQTASHVNVSFYEGQVSGLSIGLIEADDK